MNFNLQGISDAYVYNFANYIAKIIITLIVFGHFNKRIQKSIDKTSYGYKSAVYYWTIEIRKKVATFFNCKYTRKDKVTEMENNQWDILGVTYGIVMISPAFVLIPFTLGLGYWGVKLGCPVDLSKVDSIWTLIDVLTKYGCFHDDIGICLMILFVFCITSLITGIDFTFTDLRKSIPVITLTSLVLAGYDKLIFNYLDNCNIGWNKPLLNLIYLITLFIYLSWRWVLAVCWTFRHGDTNEVTGEDTVPLDNENVEDTVPLDNGEGESQNTVTDESTGVSSRPSRRQVVQNAIQSTQDILNVLNESGIDSFAGTSLRQPNSCENTSSRGDNSDD